MIKRAFHVLPAVVALAAAAVFTFRRTYDPDLFWHLAQGRHDLYAGLARTNVFNPAFSAYPQHYTSYGFEILQWISDRLGGLAGVQVLQWGLLAAAFLMLYAAARTTGSRVAAFAVLLVGLFVVEPRAMPRPYLISFVGLAFCSWWLSRRPMVNGQWPMIIGLAVWSNFHSESVFGVTLIFLAGKLHGSTWSAMVKTWVLCAVATLATPYGFGLWRYLYENTAVPSALRIAELEAPTLAAYPAFFALLAILAVALISTPKRLKFADVAISVFFATLGLCYIRFMPMVVFATAPILADRIQAWIDRGWDRRAVLGTVAAVMVATAPASPKTMLAAWRVGDDALAPREYFSADAVEFLRANDITEPVFNSMNLGGYLDWTLGGQTFVDSRLQAAPHEFFVALTEASADQNKWNALVRNVNWAVVSRARPSDISGVGKFTAPEWFSVFRDPAVEIFARRAISR